MESDMGIFAKYGRNLILPIVAAISLVSNAALANDDSFTIAVIPDTQNYIDYTHQKAEGFPFEASEMFLEQLQYIADNVESKGGDIAFVTSLGDIWQHQSLKIDPEHEKRGFKRVPNPLLDPHLAPTPKARSLEMPKAREGFELLKDKVPFSVVPGNHDYDAMWTDARFPPAANASLEDWSTVGQLHSGGLDNFRSVFGSDTPFFKGKPWYVASHDGGADSAQIFSAGGYRFLHIGLQWDAPDASLEWAASIIRKYPGLPTIVSTHDYLSPQSERLSPEVIDGHLVDPAGNNSPELVWKKLISQHDQIFLVLSGHQPGQAMRVDANRLGNNVYQMLADYQDRGQTAIDAGIKPGWGIGDGWMRLMTFDMAAKTPVVKVRTYSTHYKKQSSDTPEYAKWYKHHEQPHMSDMQFYAADDFVIQLTDFRKRFGQPKVN
jgi:hypothetical protein